MNPELKKALIVFSVLALAFFLAGCSEKSPGDKNTQVQIPATDKNGGSSLNSNPAVSNAPEVPEKLFSITDFKQLHQILSLNVVNVSSKSVFLDSVFVNGYKANVSRIISPGEEFTVPVVIVSAIVPGRPFAYSKESIYFVYLIDNKEFKQFADQDLNGRVN